MQKQDKNPSEAAGQGVAAVKVVESVSDIMKDVEEITVRPSKERKDFQNIQLLAAPMPQ